MSQQDLYVFLTTRPDTAAAYIFGSVLLLYMMVVAIFVDQRTRSRLLGLLAALLAGLMAYFFSGSVSVATAGIRCTGAIAVVCLVLAYWLKAPAQLNSAAAGSAAPPSALKGMVHHARSSPRIRALVLIALVAILLVLLPALSLAPEIQIKIIPPSMPLGGVTSRANIGGEALHLRCAAAHRELAVLVYAQTATGWYIQPEMASPLIPLDLHCKWLTWTHGGGRYAVLLVRRSPPWSPASPLQVLPLEDPRVVASVEVAGR